MKIAFVWQGVNGRYGKWRDGLYQAMKIIEEKYEVLYLEPSDEIPEDAIVLYWEAPCTILGKDSQNYKRIMSLPNRKALLFAGGQVQKAWVDGFNHVFVESKINADEFAQLGISYSTAFGVNDTIFKPEKQQKVFDGMMQATFAGWKRQWLFAEALENKGLLCGRYQEEDSGAWSRAEKAIRIPEMPAEGVCSLLNASHVAVNTSEYWGGGQRCTLEAMACGIPVIVMSDSPKNREYVEESGAGLVCEPTIEAIRSAVNEIKGWDEEKKRSGVDYIRSKWTAKHYAENLLKWIES